MQALITGASGLLGWWLGKVLSERSWLVWGGFRTLPAGEPTAKGGQSRWRWGEAIQLDLTSPSSIEGAVKTVAPDVLFHLGALTDVDRCEAQPQLARQVNVLGSSLVAKAAVQHGARLCHVSTDYVFDGYEAPYDESFPPNPINVYGETKRAGEAALHYAHPDPLIIRSAHYGLFPGRPTSLSRLIQKLKAGESVAMRADSWFTPLSSLTLAEALANLAPVVSGLRHLPGEPISRFDWALAVAAAIGADRSLVHPLGEVKSRPLGPDQVGRLTRPGPAPDWGRSAPVPDRDGTPRPHDTRLSTMHAWDAPPLAADLKRMLDACSGEGAR